MTECRRLLDIGESEFSRRLSHEGVGLRIGPFNANLQVAVDGIAKTLFDYYSSFPCLESEEVFSFRVRIEPSRSYPGIRPRSVRFSVDGLVPHEDLPIEQSLPVLEWGINLVIALRSHAFLMLHTAVVEKKGKALLLPAAPGFGKSTLCAALVFRGWRLLSDEFGLIRPEHRELIPVPRPIALKNDSIGVIRDFAEGAFIGPTIMNTRKGDVAHVAPPSDSVLRQADAVPARWVIFPRWVAKSSLALDPISSADGFMKLAMNAFNYELLGEAGFKSIRSVIDAADCYRLVYSDLEEAVAVLDKLADENGPN